MVSSGGARSTLSATRHLIGPSGARRVRRAARSTAFRTTAAAWRSVPQPLTRGTEYNASGGSRRSRRRRSSRGRRPEYPSEISPDGRYLEVGPGKRVPPFGTREANDLAPPRVRRPAPAAVSPDLPSGRGCRGHRAGEPVRRDGGDRGLASVERRLHATTSTRPRCAACHRSSRSSPERTSGYCQHFAGAMALMLRYLGIPARVAAGFTSGAYDAEQEDWRVNDRNAHTWVEVWFDGYGWLPFDPTPGRGNLGGTYTTSSISVNVSGVENVLRKSLRSRVDQPAPLPAREPRPAARRRRRGFERRRGEGARRRLGGARASRSRGSWSPASRRSFSSSWSPKLAFRRSRFLTGDPRAIATACRRELVGYLLESGSRFRATSGSPSWARSCSNGPASTPAGWSSTWGWPATARRRAARTLPARRSRSCGPFGAVCGARSRSAGGRADCSRSARSWPPEFQSPRREHHCRLQERFRSLEHMS